MNKTLFLLLSLALLWGCLDDPFENHSLQLEAEAGVTEAWLSLRVEGLKSGAVYTLQRNGAVIFNSRLQTADTVIYDSLLTPATTYRYRFFASEQGETSPAAETVLTTMDTTSHDFDWQVYTFGGQKGTSLFYDVAIIDENDIWAVGEIHTAETDRWNEDSTKWIPPYNAAHWDGQKWTLLHVNGNGSPIHVIQAFATNDIWFQGVLHWDGLKYTLHNKNFPLMSNGDGWRMNKMWGISSDDFYVVGNKGMMAHYDGTGWTKIETGTEENIKDIMGVATESDADIYATAVTLFFENERKILHLRDGQVIGSETWPYETKNPETVWLKSPLQLFVAGNGVYVKKRNLGWRIMKESLGKYVFNIRGNDINDIFIVGDRKLLMHYNGRTWKNYTYYGYGSLDAVAVKGDLVVAVGLEYPPALIYMGKR